MHIASELIDPEADKVVRRLARHGYKAYLVGGCVRDLLLGRTPKDFDVATSATPKDIKQLFRNCRIIGRRFRLAHVFFGSKIIETSTFRANPRDGEGGDEGDEILIRRDNVFGSETEDAQRRDFTMNGLFYDVEAEQVIDHVGGLADVEARLVATIGDPDIRFREDPVRILRAIKFAARLDFAIEPSTLSAAIRHRTEIAKCAPPRVLEEVYRFLRGGAARRSIELLCETGTAAVLSPQLAQLYGGVLGEVSAPRATVRLATVSAPLDAPLAPADPVAVDPEAARWAAVWAHDEPLQAHDDELGYDDLADEPVVPALGLVADPANLEQHRGLAYRALAQLDVLFVRGVETSNAFLTALMAAPFVYDDLMQPGLRPIEAAALVEGLLGPLVGQLQIARKDAERARQILLLLRRLSPGKRRRGGGPRQDAVEEAELVADVLAVARGELSVDEAYQGRARPAAATSAEAGPLPAEDDADPRGKRRRRRRGGRRRRPGGEGFGGGPLDATSEEVGERTALAAADGSESFNA